MLNQVLSHVDARPIAGINMMPQQKAQQSPLVDEGDRDNGRTVIRCGA